MSPNEELSNIYKSRRNKYLKPLAIELEKYLVCCFEGLPHIDRIVSRAKTEESFFKKAMIEKDGKRKYSDPLNQIQDQIGARIICFYKSDIDIVKTRVLEYSRKIEAKNIFPENEKQFDYEGTHLILLLPTDVRDPKLSQSECPTVFELQIKTLFQHAWAEANHDLVYKTSQELTKDQLRKVAFTAAQSWGADEIFNELFFSLRGKKEEN